MAITGRAVTAGGGGIANRLDFTYTGGTFNERTADGVVEFLETGILTMKKDTYVDVFMVGGGAGGVTVGLSNSGGAGGSGGCTRTIVNALLQKGVAYQVVIGAGGTGGGNSGGETSAFGYTVSGGTVAAGGSGGGKGGVAAIGQVNAGDGGSNGSDGGNVGSPTTGSPGKGQGATTRELAKQPVSCMPAAVAEARENTETLELRELVVKGAAQKVILQLTLRPIPAAEEVAEKDIMIVPVPAVKELRAAQVSCVSVCTKTTPLRTC